MWSGFRGSRYAYVFYTDADGQFDIAELDRLVQHANDYDLVLGYRIERRDGWHRNALSRLWNVLMKILFALDVKDVNCAFKLMGRGVINAIDVGSRAGFANAEL